MRNKSCFFMNIPSSLFGQTLGILYAPSWHTSRIVPSSVRLNSTGATRWLVPHIRLQLFSKDLIIIQGRLGRYPLDVIG
jgi:hypothetical protein